MGRRKIRLPNRRPSPKYYWDGLQWAATAIGSTQTALILVDQTVQEFMPATILRVRGTLCIRNIHATTTGLVNMKMMYVEVNDAGSMTGDNSAIDTHEEDVARRQIWTWSGMIPAGDELGPSVRQLDIDVKAKVRCEAAGKHVLLLLAQDVNASVTSFQGYLRVLLQMH